MSGAEPCRLASPKNLWKTCSSLNTGWIVLGLSGGCQRKTTADRTLQAVAGVPWAHRVHEARGRPRKQPDLPVEATTIPPAGDEVPAENMGPGVPQNYIPSSSSGYVAPTTQAAGSAQDMTAPHNAMPLIPIAQNRDHDSDALHHIKARKGMRVHDLVVEHVHESTTCGKLLTALCRLRTTRRRSLRSTRRNLTAPPLWHEVVEDVPPGSGTGAKHVTTRWERQRPWHLADQRWQSKVRFVRREYKWQAWR